VDSRQSELPGAVAKRWCRVNRDQPGFRLSGKLQYLIIGIFKKLVYYVVIHIDPCIIPRVLSQIFISAYILFSQVFLSMQHGMINSYYPGLLHKSNMVICWSNWHYILNCVTDCYQFIENISG
jgi:hypothetical protein